MSDQGEHLGSTENMEIRMEIPLDGDGYLRRGCPTCNREFKWFNGRTDETPADWQDPESYFCPYCGVGAPSDQWFTDAQRSYALQVVGIHAGELIHDELEGLARGINRQGGMIRMSVSGGDDTPLPPPLSEPNDMVAVASPCHGFEPMKVAEGWDGPLHCLICGTPFVVD